MADFDAGRQLDDDEIREKVELALFEELPKKMAAKIAAFPASPRTAKLMDQNGWVRVKTNLQWLEFARWNDPGPLDANLAAEVAIGVVSKLVPLVVENTVLASSLVKSEVAMTESIIRSEARTAMDAQREENLMLSDAVAEANFVLEREFKRKLDVGAAECQTDSIEPEVRIEVVEVPTPMVPHRPECVAVEIQTDILPDLSIPDPAPASNVIPEIVQSQKPPPKLPKKPFPTPSIPKPTLDEKETMTEGRFVPEVEPPVVFDIGLQYEEIPVEKKRRPLPLELSEADNKTQTMWKTARGKMAANLALSQRRVLASSSVFLLGGGLQSVKDGDAEALVELDREEEEAASVLGSVAGSTAPWSSNRKFRAETVFADTPGTGGQKTKSPGPGTAGARKLTKKGSMMASNWSLLTKKSVRSLVDDQTPLSGNNMRELFLGGTPRSRGSGEHVETEGSPRRDRKESTISIENSSVEDLHRPPSKPSSGGIGVGAASPQNAHMAPPGAGDDVLFQFEGDKVEGEGVGERVSTADLSAAFGTKAMAVESRVDSLVGPSPSFSRQEGDSSPRSGSPGDSISASGNFSFIPPSLWRHILFQIQRQWRDGRGRHL